MADKRKGTLVNVDGLTKQQAIDKMVEAFEAMGLEPDDDEEESPLKRVAKHLKGTTSDHDQSDHDPTKSKGASAAKADGWPDLDELGTREQELRKKVKAYGVEALQALAQLFGGSGAQGIEVVKHPEGEFFQRKDMTDDKAERMKRGNHPRFNQPALNERLAYFVGKTIGLGGLLPAMYHVPYGDEDKRSGYTFQEKAPVRFGPARHAEATEEMHQARLRAVNSDAAKAATVFDYLTANSDRHGGNWLVSPDGEMVLIDHGLAFMDVDGWVGDGVWIPRDFNHKYLHTPLEDVVDPEMVFERLGDDSVYGVFESVRLEPEYERMMSRAESYLYTGEVEGAR